VASSKSRALYIRVGRPETSKNRVVEAFSGTGRNHPVGKIASPIRPRKMTRIISPLILVTRISFNAKRLTRTLINNDSAQSNNIQPDYSKITCEPNTY